MRAILAVMWLRLAWLAACSRDAAGPGDARGATDAVRMPSVTVSGDDSSVDWSLTGARRPWRWRPKILEKFSNLLNKYQNHIEEGMNNERRDNLKGSNPERGDSKLNPDNIPTLTESVVLINRSLHLKL